MRVFLLIIVVLITALYVQYYLSYKKEYEIIQVTLDNIQLKTLYEKYPIVVADQVYKTDDLLKTVFAYSYVFKKPTNIEPDKIVCNKYKYMIITCEDNIDVKLINPKYKSKIKTSLEQSDVQYVTVKLKENQVLIVPALWYIHTDNMDVSAIGLDDFLSKIIYAVI